MKTLGFFLILMAFSLDIFTQNHKNVVVSKKTIEGSTYFDNFNKQQSSFILGSTDNFLRKNLLEAETPTTFRSNSHSVEGKQELNVGDRYGGGIVAYIFQSGDPGYISGEVHGLIATPQDQGRAEWGCLRFNRIGRTSMKLGTGMDNTRAIVEFHNSNFKDYYGSREECRFNNGTVAAKVAYELELNGYDDWYLPSKDELNILFDNKEEIGGFAEADYWSSSEGNGSWSAWFRRFYGSANQGHGHKDMNLKIRAIRTF